MSISIAKIDALLPQTQCTKCGYKDCYDYAKAIANGEKHNRCPPGGEAGIRALSELLNRPALPLDLNCGNYQSKKVAVIDESLCIGCTKCILACPVDAIIGAKQQMHTIVENDCTGCDLCVTPCPMDCIKMVNVKLEKQPENLTAEAKERQKNHYRTAHITREKRLKNKAKQQQQKHQKNIQFPLNNIDKKAYIAEALRIFKAKKQQLHHEQTTTQEDLHHPATSQSKPNHRT